MFKLKRHFKHIAVIFFMILLSYNPASCADLGINELDSIRTLLNGCDKNSKEYVINKQKLDKIVKNHKIDYSPLARFNDVKRLIAQEKYNCAVFELKELIDINYRKSECLELMGDICQYLQKSPSKTAYYYKSAINEDDNNLLAKYKLAILYLKQKRNVMGIETLRQIVQQTTSAELLFKIQDITLNKIKPQDRFEANNLYEMLGWIYEKQNNLNLSTKAYKKAIALNPDDIFLKYYLADLYLANNNDSEALKVYNSILDDNKTDSQIRISKAKILTRNGNLFDATKEYQEILSEYPTSAYAKYGLYCAYRAKFNPEQILAKINFNKPNYSPTKNDFVDFAIFLENQNDINGAKDFIEYSKKFDIKEKEEVKNYPSAYVPKAPKAQKSTTKVAKKPTQKIAQKTTQAQEQKTTLKQKIAIKKEAQKVQKPVQKQPQKVVQKQEPKKEINKETKQVQPTKKAEKIAKTPQITKPQAKKPAQKVQKQVQKTPTQQEKIAQERKTAISKNQKNYYEQKKNLDKYLALNKKDSATYIAIANTYRSMGEYTNSILNYKEAIKLDPVNSDIYFNMALSYLELNDLTNAKINLEKSIGLDSSNSKAVNMLSFVEQKIITKIINNAYEKFNNKDYISAIQILDNGIKNYPTNSQLYYYRALASDGMKRNAAQIIDLQKALELNPGYYMAYYQLGKAYEKINDEKSALVAYEKFLSTEPDEKDLINEVQNKVINLGNKYY